MNEKTFDFTPLMLEIQDELQPESRKTFAKLCDVFNVNLAELEQFRNDCKRILKCEGIVVDKTWHDTRISMQARELLAIILKGLPESPEVFKDGSKLDDAPY